jgi:1,2-diacylglycerol-3-alpha-glucose alpha-1,2-glucosyltransferase
MQSEVQDKMKVCVYNGSMKLIEKSGVGSAVKHQRRILAMGGNEVVDRMDSDTQVVHLNTVFPNSVWTAIRAKLQKKTIVYYGHSTMEDFRNSFKCSNLLAPLFRTWIKFCYNLGDVILTPTEYSRQLLLSYDVKKPVVAISNGIDIRKYGPDRSQRQAFCEKYGISEDKKIVISVGHYIERKGVLEFVEMAKKMPAVQFIWFGYTNPKLIPQSVQGAIASAPDNLIFPGYVVPEELLCAYQSCDLFCFMSHEETEGIVVLEALACGTPTLVRDIPVYSDWLKNGENVYKADETEEFVEVAEKMLLGALPDLTANGRKVAEERDFVRIAEKLNRIYDKYCHTEITQARGRQGALKHENTNC